MSTEEDRRWDAEQDRALFGPDTYLADPELCRHLDVVEIITELDHQVVTECRACGSVISIDNDKEIDEEDVPVPHPKGDMRILEPAINRSQLDEHSPWL